MWTRIRRRMGTRIRRRILHLDDTPHRIAFGVFLGFLVGWTPTMGVQIVLYWLLAWLLRANRVSGVLPVLLTNPITAVPVYVFNWKVGQVLLHPSAGLAGTGVAAGEAKLLAFLNAYGVSHVVHAGFWRDFWQVLQVVGRELVVGCLVVGAVCGALGYAATFYGVLAYRRRRAARPAAAAS